MPSGFSNRTELVAGPLLSQWRQHTKGFGVPENSLGFGETDLDKKEEQKALDRHRIQQRKLGRKRCLDRKHSGRSWLFQWPCRLWSIFLCQLIGCMKNRN